jgi:hypothetical protein
MGVGSFAVRRVCVKRRTSASGRLGEWRLKIDLETERSRELARNLVELLSPYEEELMGLERQNPSAGPLRRAVGMAIAEACYLISDDGAGREAWTTNKDA